jgi:hypothetical protein
MATFTGNRFEAFLSPNRTLVDINDRKVPGRLLLLKLADIQDMRDHVERILLEGKTNGFKVFALEHPHAGKRSRILGVNEEDAQELLDLLGKLEGNMTPI